MTQLIKTIVLILLMGNMAQSVAIDRNVYFVGNSLTYRMKPATGLRSLAQERGHTLSGQKISEDFMQIRSGASLWWHWYHGDFNEDSFHKDKFIPDMTNNLWDTLVLQPYDGKPWHLNDFPLREDWNYWQDRPREEGDIPMCVNFIDLMVNQGISGSSLQVYIYSQWPKVSGATDNPDFEHFDYPTQWNQGYPDTSRFNNRSREYYEYVMRELRKETASWLDKEILMIPMGDALYELNERLRDNPLVNDNDTYDDIADIYGDGNHLSTGVTQYFKALVFFAVFYKEDPRGLTTGNYADIDWYLSLYHPYFIEITPEWKTLLQETAWQVVATHFYSGVRNTLIPGDADLDGKVDATDFNILASAWGRTDIDPYKTGIGWRNGDFDGDGDVDQSDLDIYQANADTSGNEPPKLLIPIGLTKNDILNKTVVYGDKYFTPIHAASAQGNQLHYELKHAPANAKLDNYHQAISWEANLLGHFQFDIIIKDAEQRELVLKININVEQPQLTDYGIEKISELSKEEVKKLPAKAFQAFRQSDIIQLNPEIFNTITAEQISYLTYSAISAISVEQFLNMSPKMISHINTTSLGGFSPDVLAQFTAIHVRYINENLAKLPSEDIAKIITHLDLNKINIENLNDLLPSGWFIDEKTGVNIPGGVWLSVKTIENQTTTINMSALPKLDSKTPTILEAMNQALNQNDLGQFSFTQDVNGIVKAADNSGLQFAFIPNKTSFEQKSNDAVTEITFNQRELRIVTPEKQALSLLPAPKDMILLQNILPLGEIYMNDRGEVIFNYANVSNGDYDVVTCTFDAFVETLSTDAGVYISRQTAHITQTGEYQSPEGKIIYSDSTAQSIYPSIIESTIFLTMLHQIDGLESVETHQNSYYVVKFEGNNYILQPDFTATAYKLSSSNQLISPTIEFQEGGFLQYRVISNDIEYTQKLFLYPIN